MDFNLIKRLVKLADDNNLSILEIEENGFKIKIAKDAVKEVHHSVRPIHSTIQDQQSLPFDEVPNLKPEKNNVQDASDTKGSLHQILSPLVGTFYRAASPTADPYVKVGDIVSEGTILCVIESMKVMNEIESDITGKVVKVLIENSAPVEYGSPLFIIEKT